MTITKTRPDYAAARKAMIDSQLRTSGVNEAFVLERMGAVPREDFVPEGAKGTAYMDRAIRLAEGGYLPAPLFHGAMLAEAHPALSGFILQSQALGRRLVLVITGKGKLRDDPGPIPRRHGVLRHQVPQWLRMPPLNHAVLQVREAHIRHGGHGALYIYLGRRR